MELNQFLAGGGKQLIQTNDYQSVSIAHHQTNYNYATFLNLTGAVVVTYLGATGPNVRGDIRITVDGVVVERSKNTADNVDFIGNNKMKNLPYLIAKKSLKIEARSKSGASGAFSGGINYMLVKEIA